MLHGHCQHHGMATDPAATEGKNVENRLHALRTAVKKRPDDRVDRQIRVQEARLRDRGRTLNSRLLYR